jgi:hypothetical protein
MKIPWKALKGYDNSIYNKKECYIYCYTNKLNNHKYVGQTNNYKRKIYPLENL